MCVFMRVCLCLLVFATNVYLRPRRSINNSLFFRFVTINDRWHLVAFVAAAAAAAGLVLVPHGSTFVEEEDATSRGRSFKSVIWVTWWDKNRIRHQKVAELILP